MTGTERADADPATRPPGRMTATEFRSLYERLRGQLPWGPDDRRGALNYITPAEVLAAVGEVRLGRTISLAAPVEHRPAAGNPDPAQHQMKGPLGADAGPGLAFSMDRIAGPVPAGLSAVHRAQPGVRGDRALVIPVRYRAAAAADRDRVAGQSDRDLVTLPSSTLAPRARARRHPPWRGEKVPGLPF